MKIDKQKKTKVQKTANLFVTGVVALTVANLIIKIIGVMLKVPLAGIIGNNGMGFYNGAYDVYVWLYMVSTAGLPVAIAMLVSESRAKGNLREPQKIFGVTIKLLAAVGLVGTCAVLFGSGLIADKIYKMPGLEWSLCAIAPTLFFICISCAIRGYFQGYQIMMPSAISEVMEALGKLIFGIAFAWMAMNVMPEDLVVLKGGNGKFAVAAAMTILGLTLGVALAMLYLIVKKARFNSKPYDQEFLQPDSYNMPMRTNKQILKALVVIAIPITISSSVMSFTSLLDGVIISNTMQSAWNKSASDVTEIIGIFKTQVVTLFNLPPALIYPISGSIVPYLSGMIVSGNKEKIHNLMNSSIRVAAIIALPCAFGMSALSQPIIRLFFNSTYAPEVCDSAPLLSIQALAVFFVGMLAMTTSILQAHKLERKPIISMLAGGAVKILSSWILIGKIGIYGAPIGTLLCYITIVVFNFYFVAKYVKFIPKFSQVFLKPIISAVLCALAAMGSYYGLVYLGMSWSISVLAAICVAAVVYLVLLLLTRAFKKEDFEIIPKGEKIYSLLCKCNLMK